MRYLLWLLALLVPWTALAHDHLESRLFVIRSQLVQAGPSSVVFAGDSITEAALLPASVCGRTVVNAGIGGTTAYTYALAVKRLEFQPDAIVVAIGTNDSRPGEVAEFPDRYRFLNKILKRRTSILLYVGIPPLENGPRAAELDAVSSDAIERSIRDTAGRDFIDIRPALPKPATIDGVHLSSFAQSIWIDTIVKRLKSSLGC
jgi:lysophospholipase L1-like esterase